MSDDKSKTMTALGALSAVGKALSFLEKLLIAGFFMMLEFSRIKRKQAENKAAKAEADLAVKEKHDEIERENEGKDSVDVIDDYLDEQSSNDE